MTEQCPATTGCADNGGISGLTYRGQNSWSADWLGSHTWNLAASVISGANNMKFGYQGAYYTDNRSPGRQRSRVPGAERHAEPAH